MKFGIKQEIAFGIILLACTRIAITAQATTTPPANDLFDASVEELLRTKVTVTSVSKREEDLFKAASAVYVITAEDIRRSGLTSLPELLRLAPGMNVGQITSQKWAVTARGFNGISSDKLLVLVDGRTIYTAFFGGVHWEVQDYPLEDIERIEVIRGPGGTLWGANAVNGVVNIISKKSSNTQGTLVTGLGGTYDRAMGLARHGGKLSENTTYRVYAKYFKRDQFVHSDGSGWQDEWDIKSGGFQTDGKVGNDSWMMQGKKYSGGGLSPGTTPSLPETLEVLDTHSFRGQHLLGTWAHPLKTGSDLSFKAFYDETDRQTRPIYSENRYIWDFEAQHHYTLFPRQDIVWGLGARATSGKVGTTPSYPDIDPIERIESTYNFFIQDQIAIKKDFNITLGTKVEKNVFTGYEIQPSGRFAWTPNPENTVWGSISHAVRVPTRLLRDLGYYSLVTTPAGTDVDGVPLPLPLKTKYLPNKTMDSERLVAFELGHRMQPTKTLFSDLTIFYNVYQDVYGIQTAGDISVMVDPDGVYFLEYPLTSANGVNAKSVGLEWFADWQACENWRLKAGYSFLNIQAKSKNPFDTFLDAYWEASGPRNQFQLHSDWDFAKNMSFGAWLYYVDDLKEVPGVVLKTPSYVRGDLRLAWKPAKDFLVELVGQNLLKDQTFQAWSFDTNNKKTEIERAGYLKVRWDT